MNGSRKVEEEEETAEKKTELGDDDMSRNAGEIGAMKGQEKEKEKIQELALEEKVSDGGKKIFAEGKSENDESRKVQEIDEKQSHEEDERGNQVQKLIGGETSGQGDVEEREKRIREVDKRFREAQGIERTDSDVSEKYVKGELQEKEKEDVADTPKRRTGTTEQELVNLNSQMEQEAGEKTQELVDENINNCKEEESETKTDDVVRKVQGMKEQDLSEAERKHGSKIKEVIEKKAAEAEKEDECDGLSEIHRSEEQKLHEPSGQEREEEKKEKAVEYMRITEKESSPTAQEIKDQRPDKESHEKRSKQDLVEAGHNETEEHTSKKVREIEKEESDGLKGSVVQDKKQETEENEISRAVEEKEIMERRTETEDVSLREIQDDEDTEMFKSYKRQEEDKIQEPVEVGKSGYKEKIKKQDEIDISRIQKHGEPNFDELGRHGEQTNIPQGEDKIHEPVDMGTHDHREKVKKQDGDDVPPSVKEEKVENMAELEGKREDDSSEEATDPKESEGKEKTRAVEEKDIVERRTITRDGSFRKAQDDAEPELSKPYKPQEEDKVQEAVERGTSDYREEVKKQDGDNEACHSDHKEEQQEEKLIAKTELKSKEDEKIQEIEKQKPDELQRSLDMGTHDHSEKVNEQDGDDVPQSVEKMAELEGKMEDDSSDKFHENEERKSYEDWTHETWEKSKEEATDPKEEKEKTRAVAETEIVERRTGTRDGSLRKSQDDSEQKLSKPYKPQEEEDKVQESVERGTSDNKEELKKQDGNDTTRSKELGKPSLIREEATAKAGHSDHKEQNEEKVITKAQMKAEEDNSIKIQKIENQKSDELQRSLVQDKMQETEEKEKTRPMEEKEIVERRTKAEYGSLREFQDRKESESSKPYKRRDEDKIQEVVEMETSDYREKVKTQDGDDVLRSQETEKLDLVEQEATGPKNKHTGAKEEEERYEKVAETETKVEDETSKEVEENQKEEEDSLDDPMKMIQESEKKESHEPEIQIVQDLVEEETKDQENEVAMVAATVEANHDEDSSIILQTIKEHEEHKEPRNDPGVEEAHNDWKQEDRGMMKDLVKEEALDLRHTGGEGYNDHKEEKFIPKAGVKAEEDSSEQEFDELQRSLGQDKMQETEEKGKPRSAEENETVEGKTKTEDGSLRKVQEGEDPELSRHKRHEEELKKQDEDDILRSQETSKTKHGIKKMIGLGKLQL
ncbi:titin-like [Raphanus sativus]|nr:titin-like [Raphanus sativus]